MFPVEDYNKLETELTQELIKYGYRLNDSEYNEEIFGSRFTSWINNKENKELRLVWDGKESWLKFEERSFNEEKLKNHWIEKAIIKQQEFYTVNLTKLILKSITN